MQTTQLLAKGPATHTRVSQASACTIPADAKGYGWATGLLALMIIEKLALYLPKMCGTGYCHRNSIAHGIEYWARHHWRCRLNKAHELAAIDGDM